MEAKRILQQRVRRRIQTVTALKSSSEKSKSIPDVDLTLATERNNGIAFFLGTSVASEKEAKPKEDAREKDEFEAGSWKLSQFLKAQKHGKSLEGAGSLVLTHRHTFGERQKRMPPRSGNAYQANRITCGDVAEDLHEAKREINLLEDLESPALKLDPFRDEWRLQDELGTKDRFSIMAMRGRHRAPMKESTTLVPLYSKEYQTKGALDDREEFDDIESFQFAQNTVMDKLRELVADQRQSVQHHTTLESILIEEKAPGIAVMGIGMLKFTLPRRPLRPRRKERKKVMTASVIQRQSDFAEADLIVTILRATNVPIRSDLDRRVSSPSNAFQSHTQLQDSIIQVRPFVEVSFQQNTRATFISDGPNPTWNQQLTLPIRNDTFQGDNRDFIYLNICDQVVIDLHDDDDKDHIHQILERRWLGTLAIPFSTVYLNSKIEGTFRIESPPILFGYDYESKQWPQSIEQNNFILLSLFMTIEPPLQLPKMIFEKLPSGEPEHIFTRCSRFEATLKQKFPSREIRALTASIDGKMILVTRFIHPIMPPRDLLFEMDALPIKMERLARFVSLIPTVSDSILFPGICDIWTTCEQFLQVLVGDEEEHALLLCNYFLFLGVNAYILLGNGIPEGSTSYVITFNNSAGGVEDRIWNAVTGKSYSLSDVNSPLQSVGCIISGDNVWANIQEDERPCRVQFTLGRTNLWRPLFRSDSNIQLHTIQSDKIEYSVPDKLFATKLENALETHLRESIMRWRKQERTIWNRHHCRLLRTMLPKFEEHLQRKDTIGSENLLDAMTSHKVSGFPLSMTFVSLKAVTDAVKATGVHLTRQSGTEFALAVYVHPYPSQVFAVWVYLATIARRDY